MLILTIRTDKPEAELGLFKDGAKLAYSEWPAHRRLAETIHAEIRRLLGSQGLELKDIAGVGVFRGPGSFTGLRIGISVANTLADALGLPVVSAAGKNWLDKVCQMLAAGENERIAIPEYGAEPNVSKPRK